MRAVKRRTGGKGSPRHLDRLASVLVQEGGNGNVAAIKEVGDRLDGKPAQAIAIKGDPDSPVIFNLRLGGTLLLEDLRDLFIEDGGDTLFTETILAALAKMTDRPWPEWKNAKPMTSRQLAKLLGRYRVKSKTVWRGEKSAKGYNLTDLEEHFACYLDFQSVNPSEPQKPAGYSEIQSVREQPVLTDSKRLKPAENRHSDGLTDWNPESGGEHGKEPWRERI